MASLNLLARLSLVWVQLTFWHRPPIWQEKLPLYGMAIILAPLSVNCMRCEKSPYITVDRSRFSSKGHMTLLISEFQSTETWRKSSLWMLKEKCNSWLVSSSEHDIYVYIYIYINIYIYNDIYNARLSCLI